MSRVNNRCVLAVLMATTSLTSAPFVASAQDAEETVASDVIIVTGRGREEDIQEVPISQTAFTAAAIEDARIDQVDDFFALTPGVTFANAQDAGTNFITIRGISQVRNGESPVAVVVDDVLQVNSRSFDQGLFDLASVEILRGPQGALYGRNATGGAVIITTKAPTDEFQGYGKLTYGDANEIGVEGSVSGPIMGETLTGRVSARFTDRDGYLENVILDEGVDYLEEYSLRGHLSWLITDGLTADLRASMVSTTAGALNYSYQPAVVDKTTGLPSAFDFTISDANLVEREFTANNLGVDERDAKQLSLRLNADLGFATFRSVTAYDHIEQTAWSDQFPYTTASTVTPAPPFPFFDGVQSQHIEVEAVSQEVRLTSPDDQAFRWMAGAYYVATERFINSSIYNDLENGLPTISTRSYVYDPLAPQTSFIADDNDNTAWAVFFNTEYDVTDKLEVAFAGRYDLDEREQTVDPTQGNYADGVFVSATGVPGSVNTAEFDLFQPKLTARYAATDDLNLYASWGLGFRSGQFNQNGVGEVAAGAGVLGVSDMLDQEETETFEIGSKLSLPAGGALNGALYMTDVTNAPYFVFIGAVSAQVLVPIDEIEIFGGEVEFSIEPMDGLDLYVSGSFADSRIAAYTVNPSAVGNSAPYVAANTFNAGAQYTMPLTSELGLFTRLDYERRGEQFWDPENSTPRSAINLVNLRAGVESLDGTWSLIGSVDNALDEEYNSEWVTGGFAHAGMPRVWRLDLRYDF